MGGYNSGRWHWHTPKTTVEQCRKVRVSDYGKSRLAERFEAGEPVYYNESGPVVYADLLIDRVFADLMLAKGETPADKPRRNRQAGQHFYITRTACNYGGWRYWLLCPGCERRCMMLYQPPGDDRFRCRVCHDLSYTSAQTAHQYDRGSLATFARNMDLITRAELVMRKIDKCRGSSKNFWRLVRRFEQIMSGVKRGAIQW